MLNFMISDGDCSSLRCQWPKITNQHKNNEVVGQLKYDKPCVIQRCSERLLSLRHDRRGPGVGNEQSSGSQLRSCLGFRSVRMWERREPVVRCCLCQEMSSQNAKTLKARTQTSLVPPPLPQLQSTENTTSYSFCFTASVSAAALDWGHLFLPQASTVEVHTIGFSNTAFYPTPDPPCITRFVALQYLELR